MTDAEPPLEALLSCGDVTTDWLPQQPGESVQWAVCPDPLCHGARRVVKEIRPRPQ